MNRIMRTLVLPLGAAVVVGTAGFAYMDANTTANSSGAGENSETVSGYAIQNLTTDVCGSVHGTANPNDTCEINFSATPLTGSQLPARKAVATPQDVNGNATGDAANCTISGSGPSPDRYFKCTFTSNNHEGVDTLSLKHIDLTVTG